MEDTEQTVVLCPTKAGNGFKIVVNGIWYYAAKRNVWSVLRKGQSCVFRTIDDAGRSNGMRKPLPRGGASSESHFGPDYQVAAESA